MVYKGIRVESKRKWNNVHYTLLLIRLVSDNLLFYSSQGYCMNEFTSSTLLGLVCPDAVL